MAAELNGRPAHAFEVVISERQFRMSCDGEVFAESSSVETFCRGLAKMWKCAGKSGTFMFVPDKTKPS